MTKEEVELTFSGVSPYYAYMQGVQDGVAYNEESFRREAAKDILAGMVSNPKTIEYGITRDLKVSTALKYADELIAKLKEK